MNAELENKLYKDHPLIFADKDKSMSESLMIFGCECGDGWYNIIEALCQSIDNWYENECRNNKGNPPAPVVAAQIKEKFGSLKFYTTGHCDEVQGMITMAENLSAMTCEQCGRPGTSRGNGLLYTACSQCAGKS